MFEVIGSIGLEEDVGIGGLFGVGIDLAIKRRERVGLEMEFGAQAIEGVLSCIRELRAKWKCWDAGLTP